MSRPQRRVTGGAAREGSPSRHGREFEVGDRVRILDIPEDLKDPNYDLKHDTGEHKLRTSELFRFCLGRVFTIYGFGRFGLVELRVDRSPAVREEGFSGTIWIEPEFLKRVSKRKKKQKG